jgi:protein-tyrosine phosphatase
MPVKQRVLFICTGNYYRSRFAEAIFNHHAAVNGSVWKAFSRGLAIHMADGPLSTHTQLALESRKIDLAHTGLDRVQLTEKDLEQSFRNIALDQREHLAMMEAQFPHWADKIDYWNVADIPYDRPENALPEIERKVLALIKELLPQKGQ